MPIAWARGRACVRLLNVGLLDDAHKVSTRGQLRLADAIVVVGARIDLPLIAGCAVGMGSDARQPVYMFDVRPG